MFSRTLFRACAALLLSTSGYAADHPQNAAVTPLVEYVAAHRDGRVAYSIDFDALARDRRQLPIGVFDSGIGGLTVMEAILQSDAFHNDTLQPGPDGVPDFANEKFVYFGDQANMPYGNYPARGREDLLRELILKDAIFLLGVRARQSAAAPPQFHKPSVKAIVIACNTATAYGLEDIRGALVKWQLDVPVIGVIEAGARAVAESIAGDGQQHGIAVLATVGTCATGAYPKAINREIGRRGKRAPVIVQQGSVGLAGAIEGNPAFISAAKVRAAPYQGPAAENKDAPVDSTLKEAYQFDPAGLLEDGALNSMANYARYDVTTVLETQRRGSGAAIDTVVLGCTHFPLAKAELARAFTAARDYRDPQGAAPYRALVAETLQFIDPAESSARELFRELARQRLRNTDARPQAPQCRFFLSVPNAHASGVQLAQDGSLEASYKSSRPVGQWEVEDTVAVPLTSAKLPSASLRLVQSLPAVWREMEVPVESGL